MTTDPQSEGLETPAPRPAPVPAGHRVLLWTGVVGACALGVTAGLWARPGLAERRNPPQAQMRPAAPDAARRLQIIVDDTPAPLGAPIEVLPAFSHPQTQRVAAPAPVEIAPRRPASGLMKAQAIGPVTPAIADEPVAGPEEAARPERTPFHFPALHIGSALKRLVTFTPPHRPAPAAEPAVEAEAAPEPVKTPSRQERRAEQRREAARAAADAQRVEAAARAEEARQVAAKRETERKAAALAAAEARQAEAREAKREAARVEQARLEQRRMELAEVREREARLEKVRLQKVKAEKAKAEKVRLARLEAERIEREEARREARVQQARAAKAEEARIQKAKMEKARRDAERIQLAKLEQAREDKARKDAARARQLADARKAEKARAAQIRLASNTPKKANRCASSDAGEALVCADPQLSAADRRLSRAYREAQAAGVPEWRLREQQDRWRSARSAAAREAPWQVREVYLARIAELNDMASDAQGGN